MMKEHSEDKLGPLIGPIVRFHLASDPKERKKRLKILKRLLESKQIEEPIRYELEAYEKFIEFEEEGEINKLVASQRLIKESLELEENESEKKRKRAILHEYVAMEKHIEARDEPDMIAQLELYESAITSYEESWNDEENPELRFQRSRRLKEIEREYYKVKTEIYHSKSQEVSDEDGVEFLKIALESLKEYLKSGEYQEVEKQKLEEWQKELFLRQLEVEETKIESEMDTLLKAQEYKDAADELVKAKYPSAAWHFYLGAGKNFKKTLPSDDDFDFNDVKRCTQAIVCFKKAEILGFTGRDVSIENEIEELYDRLAKKRKKSIFSIRPLDSDDLNGGRGLFVHRDELEEIKQIIASQDCATIAIVGERGVGKSTLSNQLMDDLAGFLCVKVNVHRRYDPLEFYMLLYMKILQCVMKYLKNNLFLRVFEIFRKLSLLIMKVLPFLILSYFILTSFVIEQEGPAKRIQLIARSIPERYILYSFLFYVAVFILSKVFEKSTRVKLWKNVNSKLDDLQYLSATEVVKRQRTLLFSLESLLLPFLGEESVGRRLQKRDYSSLHITEDIKKSISEISQVLNRAFIIVIDEIDKMGFEGERSEAKQFLRDIQGIVGQPNTYFFLIGPQEFKERLRKGVGTTSKIETDTTIDTYIELGRFDKKQIADFLKTRLVSVLIEEDLDEILDEGALEAIVRKSRGTPRDAIRIFSSAFRAWINEETESPRITEQLVISSFEDMWGS